MTEWIRAKWDRLRSSYWFIPSVMAVVSILLALIPVDQYFPRKAIRQQNWIYAGGADGARAVLSTIAGSIIAVAGTTFSITVAALTLASAQFGPRLLRNFMRDTGNQIVLGTFTSTFLYCILILRTVRELDDNTNVPHIAVTIGVALAVLSLGVLIYFIHHIAESIQVSHIIDVVARELHETIERLFPSHLGAAGGTEEPSTLSGTEVTATQEGYLERLDDQALMAFSQKKNLILKLLRRPGDYIIRGAPLVLVSPGIEENEENQVRGAFLCGRSRTPYQDAVFAFLQLAEIAVRALSPGINDPFTAIMCVNRITSEMAEVAARSMPDPVRRDASGSIRIIARPYSYDDLVEAGYRHIREAARGHWQVCRHLRVQLEFLATRSANPEMLAAVRRELRDLT